MQRIEAAAKPLCVLICPRSRRRPGDRLAGEAGENVHAELTNTRFPEKTYGDCTFPAGNYDALRITIGEAKGKNWWCVLFPSLCFVDTVHGVVPEESKELLKNVLTEEEYESLFTPGKSEYKVRWKAAEIWQSLFG